jgi:hypothetical protein
LSRRPAGGAARLRRRALCVWAAVWCLGALPSVLRMLFDIPVPPALEVFGWGLWLPGAGFVAVGGWWLLVVPVVLGLSSIAVLVWSLSGMLLAPLALWLGTALWAAAVADDAVFQHAHWLVPVLSAAYVLRKVLRERQQLVREAVQGAARACALPALLADLQQRATAARDPQELDTTQLAAARYLFDLTLQPVGELKGFTHIDNIQSASLRYQLNYCSYALAAMQCRYTPNFHGYLNQAQRFAIESLALPQVCGYWKWEYLWGRLRWNPDPVGTLDNVMLTGWSQVALTTYAANTGDLRYQQSSALAFKPLRNGQRTYPHSAHTFTESIIANWQHSPTALYACEPHWVFPLCNAYAYAGLVPYDRVNGTSHAADHHARLLNQLEADFLLPNGEARPVLSTLTGWSWLGHNFPPHVRMVFLLQLSRVAHAFHPGYARRWYLMAREECIQLDPAGRLTLLRLTWEELIDAGHYRKGPGYFLSLLAQTAREHGDEAIADAALREIELRLTRSATPGVLAYEGVSTLTNINIALACLAGPSDWQHLIFRGPAAATLQGPVLTDVRYPDVLVAAAHGDVHGLNLVLYAGRDAGPQTLRIERLQPKSRYRVEGASPPQFETGEGQTSTTLTAMLHGRTIVQLRRES